MSLGAPSSWKREFPCPVCGAISIGRFFCKQWHAVCPAGHPFDPVGA